MRITVGQLRSPLAIPLHSRFDESRETGSDEPSEENPDYAEYAFGTY
jgi:hypothetical protein